MALGRLKDEQDLENWVRRLLDRLGVSRGASAAPTAHAEVRSAANVSIANATWTRSTWATETVDKGGMVDLATQPTRVTIQKAGVYAVRGRAQWAANAANDRWLNFYVNGAAEEWGNVRATTGTGGGMQHHILRFREFAAGDYIELYVYQDSGGALLCWESALEVVYLGGV